MHKQVGPAKENQSYSVANSATQNQTQAKQVASFVDNRREAASQRQISAMANNHAHNSAIQFASVKSNPSLGFSNLSTPIQFQTDIKHTSTNMTWKTKSATVGVKVVADLDPNHKVTGSAVGGKDMYTEIDKEVSKYNNGAWARGHLLNHDLGGKGVPENLFPITSGANKRHANFVEYRVKDALNLAKHNNKEEDVEDKVHYEVEVRGNPSNAQFVCDWQYQDKDGAKKQPHADYQSEGSWVIPSKLRGPAGGDNPPADPYHNSLDAPANLPIIWHHGDNRGGDAVDTDKVNWTSQDADLKDLLSQQQITDEGYGYADGEMSDAEKAAIHQQRLRAKMQTLEDYCKDKILISIRANIAETLYDRLYRDVKYKRKLSQLKEDYADRYTAAAISLHLFIAGFVRNEQLLGEIAGEHDDNVDFRPYLPPKIRETDQYNQVVQTLTQQLLIEERTRKIQRGSQRLGLQGIEQMDTTLQKVPSIERGDRTDQELDERDANELYEQYKEHAKEEAHFTSAEFKEAADRILVTILLMTRQQTNRVEIIQANLDILEGADTILGGERPDVTQGVQKLQLLVDSYEGGSITLKNLKRFEQVIRAKVS